MLSFYSLPADVSEHPTDEFCCTEVNRSVIYWRPKRTVSTSSLRPWQVISWISDWHVWRPSVRPLSIIYEW